MKLFDTHSHLNLKHYDEDREIIIEKIFSSGVEKLIIPSIDEETIKTSLTLSEKYSEKIYSALGYHPQDASKWDKKSYELIKNSAKNKSVVAIGEIGLDYYWDTTPKEIQHQVFKEQINLALELNLPMIIHTRESLDDTMKILKEKKAQKVGGVFHCFSGDIEFAKEAIEIGFYISFAGNITFKNAGALREIAKEVDLKHILIETDSPYLTPMPDRGKRNDSSYVKYVAEKIAELKNISVEEVANTTYQNALNLFKISK